MKANKKGFAFVILTVLLVTLLISIGGVKPVLAAAPSNDDMASATVVGALPYTDTVDTTDASVELSEPPFYCGYQVGATVWYRYTPSTTGDVYINTEGSDFNTTLFVYLDSDLTPLGCNSDGYDSKILITLDAGITYLIGVGGNSSGTGNLVYNMIEPGVFTSCSSVDVLEAECNVLEALYTATNGGAWNETLRWLETDLVCTWYGITCYEGSITQMVMMYNNMAGDLSLVDFTDLTNLIMIQLGSNLLTGDLTAIVHNMPLGLQSLSLSHNDLTGTVPSSISGFTSLSGLVVSDNQLSGDIADVIDNVPPSIFILDLGINDFFGTIPASALSLTGLYTFSAEGNLLSGDISTAIGNLPTGLAHLKLGNNSFTGSVPSGISTFTNLSSLRIENNNLGGPIADVINVLPSNLNRVYLNGNAYTGEVPSSISSLTQLYEFHASDNQISGDLATLIGYFPATMTDIYLDNNELTGTIPSTISNLVNLDYLVLNNNPGINGTVPLSITGLPIRYFDFEYTFLCEPDDSGYDLWVLTVSYYYPGYCKAADVLLFSDDFETGDFSLWTRFNDGKGYLYPCTKASINGIYGACVDRGTDKRKQLIDETPINQTAYDVRFNIDIHSLSMAAGSRFRFIQVKMGADRPFFIVLKRQGGQYLIQLNTLLDDLTKVKTGWYPLSDAPHTIEISWSAATHSGADNGWAAMYLDDILQEGLVDLDNDSIIVDTFKIGFTSRLDGKPISGIFYLDDIASSNSGLIGLP